MKTGQGQTLTEMIKWMILLHYYHTSSALRSSRKICRMMETARELLSTLPISNSCWQPHATAYRCNKINKNCHIWLRSIDYGITQLLRSITRITSIPIPPGNKTSTGLISDDTYRKEWCDVPLFDTHVSRLFYVEESEQFVFVATVHQAIVPQHQPSIPNCMTPGSRTEIDWS